MKINQKDIKNPGKTTKNKKPQNTVRNEPFYWEKKAKSKRSPKTKWLRTVRAQLIKNGEEIVQGNVVVKKVLATGKIIKQGYKTEPFFDPNSGGYVDRWTYLGHVTEYGEVKNTWELASDKKQQQDHQERDTNPGIPDSLI